MDQLAQGFMSSIRDVSQTIEGLARQFPAGAQHAQQSLMSLKDMMVAVVSSLKQEGQANPAPNIAA